jgi:hypothetical protein
MRHGFRTGVIVTAVAVTVSFLTVCVPGIGAAQSATTAGGPAGAATLWAYGGLGSRSWGGTGGAYRYDASVTAGFAVIINETIGTGGVITLSIDRTMGLLLYVEYCLPSCGHPTETATVHFHAWEVDRALLNLTTDGSVNVSGAPTAALGLLSSATSVVVGLRESSEVVVDGVPVHGRNVSVNLDANASTGFTPALGLVPLTLTPEESWSSTSLFTTVGSASWSVLETLLNGTIPVDKNGTVPLAALGNVTLNGTYAGTKVHLGGTNYDVVALTVQGPFSLREGFLLIPSGSNFFGASAPGWLSGLLSTSGSASFSQGNIDVTNSPAGGSHLGFYGSEAVWSSGTANPASDALLATDVGLTPAATADGSGPNATSVQGGPESLAQATTDQNCLASGFGCPSGSAPRSLLAELLVVAVGTVAAAVAVALVAERRRMPPPPYPNATLYPPGPASPGPVDGIRRPTSPIPPADDDPLGHLW